MAKGVKVQLILNLSTSIKNRKIRRIKVKDVYSAGLW